MTEPSTNDPSLLEKLIEAGTYGLDDLELNRKGVLSGLQRFRLMMMVIAYILLGGLGMILALGGIRMYLQQPRPEMLLAAAFWVIIFSGTGFYWLQHAIPMWQDLQAGTVKSISGPLYILYVRGGYKTRVPIYSLHYKIAKQVFDIALFAPRLLEREQLCRGYYTSHSAILVGIEPL
jgi:hypothetical protein